MRTQRLGLVLLGLMLLAGAAVAKEVRTDRFTVTLPESFDVESDGTELVLAFGPNGPYASPFLIIDFGDDIVLADIVSEIDETLAPSGVRLAGERCAPDCSAYYAQAREEFDGAAVYGHRYLGIGRGFVFLISYLHEGEPGAGEAFVRTLAAEIEQGAD